MFLERNLQGGRDVQDLYNMSLNLEPREREDEKIARLLHESGFL
jgi:son of sevenless-like protein